MDVDVSPLLIAWAIFQLQFITTIIYCTPVCIFVNGPRIKMSSNSRAPPLENRIECGVYFRGALSWAQLQNPLRVGMLQLPFSANRLLIAWCCTYSFKLGFQDFLGSPTIRRSLISVLSVQQIKWLQ